MNKNQNTIGSIFYVESIKGLLKIMQVHLALITFDVGLGLFLWLRFAPYVKFRGSA